MSEEKERKRGKKLRLVPSLESRKRLLGKKKARWREGERIEYWKFTGRKKLTLPRRGERVRLAIPFRRGEDSLLLFSRMTGEDEAKRIRHSPFLQIALRT